MRVLSLNPWTTRDSLGCIFKEIPKIGVMRLGQVQPPEASCSFKIWGCSRPSLLCARFLWLWRAGFSLSRLLRCRAQARGARAQELWHAGFSSCSMRAQWLQHAGFSNYSLGAQQLWHTGLVAPQHVGSSRTRN